MENIIDLNREIEKIFKPKVIFHHDYQTFSFFDTWIINADYDYFKNWEERIIEKINSIADLDSSSKIKFIKVFHQDVLQKYNDLKRFNAENLAELQKTFSEEYSTPKNVEKPNKLCSDISYDKDYVFDQDHNDYELIIYKLGVIFYSDDFILMQDFDDSLYGEQSNLEELILEKIELGELNLQVFKKNEETIEMLYSYVQLSVCFDNIKSLLKNITQYLDYIVNLIKKVENFEEDRLSLEEVFDNDPNNLKLEFKINKMDVALFYRALHDAGIIHVDNKNQKHPYTNLKKYIDISNMYYLENKKVEKIANINKEFAKFLNDNSYKKQEINLLELIISKFSSRKEELLADKERGIL